MCNFEFSDGSLRTIQSISTTTNQYIKKYLKYVHSFQFSGGEKITQVIYSEKDSSQAT